YGGGINGNGASIAEGGFQPYLSLFTGSGDFLGSTFFGVVCPPGANTNSVSGACYDVGLDGGILAPGMYQLAISAFSNMSYAENLGAGVLADGFTGLGNLAAGEDLHYAFDIILDSPASVPEPGTGVFLFAGAVAWLLSTRRLKSKKHKEKATGCPAKNQIGTAGIDPEKGEIQPKDPKKAHISRETRGKIQKNKIPARPPPPAPGSHPGN